MKHIEKAVTKPAPVVEELPKDLGRPRENLFERFGYYASLVIGGALLALALTLLAYGLTLV